MFAAWASWCSRKPRVARPKVKKEMQARYVPNLERCEERLPPGQLFGFSFDLLADPFAPIDLAHSRQTSPALPKSTQESSRPSESVSILAPGSVASRQREAERISYVVTSDYANISIGYGAIRSHVHYLAPVLASSSSASSASADFSAASLTDSVTGTLELLAFDGNGESRTEYYLRQGSNQMRLLADDAAMSDYVSGAVVTARGKLGSDGLVVAPDGITVQQEPPGIISTATLGTTHAPEGPFVRTALLVMINFSDNPGRPFTVASANTTLNNNTRRWYEDTSYGQSSFYADITDWLTIASGSSTCATNTWATQGQAAARAAGFNPNSYNNVIFAFPNVRACGFSGLGQIGGRFTWLNGNLNANVHELGHNLGLLHSHLSNCSDEPVGSSCTRTEYGDRFDVMGNGGRNTEFHASYRVAVGWIDPSDIVTVSPSDGYAVVGLNSVATPFGARILRVRLPGSSNSLFIERREAVGPFDSGLAQFPYLTNGVPVYIGGNTNFREQSLVGVYQTGSAQTSPLQFEDTLVTSSGVYITPHAPGNDGVTYIEVGYA